MLKSKKIRKVVKHNVPQNTLISIIRNPPVALELYIRESTMPFTVSEVNKFIKYERIDKKMQMIIGIIVRVRSLKSFKIEILTYSLPPFL
eukprot:gene6500-10508_t